MISSCVAFFSQCFVTRIGPLFPNLKVAPEGSSFSRNNNGVPPRLGGDCHRAAPVGVASASACHAAAAPCAACGHHGGGRGHGQHGFAATRLVPGAHQPCGGVDGPRDFRRQPTDRGRVPADPSLEAGRPWPEVRHHPPPQGRAHCALTSRPSAPHRTQRLRCPVGESATVHRVLQETPRPGRADRRQADCHHAARCGGAAALAGVPRHC